MSWRIRCLILLAIWVAGVILSAGFTYAYFTRKHSSNDLCGEAGFAWAISSIAAISGPFGVTIAYLMSGLGEYGWELPPITCYKVKP